MTTPTPEQELLSEFMRRASIQPCSRRPNPTCEDGEYQIDQWCGACLGRKGIAALQAQLQRAQEERHDSCPCRHTVPCHERCTCVSPASSSGCRRCCAYGSEEQQKATAEHLSAQEARIRDLEAAAVEEKKYTEALLLSVHQRADEWQEQASTLLEQKGALEAALRQVEWTTLKRDNCCYFSGCPWCRAMELSGGHAPDCLRQRALGLCRCGHSREAHSGHTVAAGQLEPTHCSQGCGCRAFALGEGR